ncbi:hypothetical protein BDW66DRAFT_90978 [Aspergillus desertorum]
MPSVLLNSQPASISSYLFKSMFEHYASKTNHLNSRTGSKHRRTSYGQRMESHSPKVHEKHDDCSDSTPEANDALQHRLSRLSLSNPNTGSPGPDDLKQTSQPQLEERAQEEPSASEEGSSVTHRISFRTTDSDEPDSDEQGEDDSDIEPEELLKTVFSIDMPREVEVRAKIKGDFTVRILA